MVRGFFKNALALKSTRILKSERVYYNFSNKYDANMINTEPDNYSQ